MQITGSVRTPKMTHKVYVEVWDSDAPKDDPRMLDRLSVNAESLVHAWLMIRKLMERYHRHHFTVEIEPIKEV